MLAICYRAYFDCVFCSDCFLMFFSCFSFHVYLIVPLVYDNFYKLHFVFCKSLCFLRMWCYICGVFLTLQKVKKIVRIKMVKTR